MIINVSFVSVNRTIQMLQLASNDMSFCFEDH